MCPGAPKFLISAYSQTTNKLYGFILRNLNQNAPKDWRVATDIFDNEITVYLPVNSKKGHYCHHDTE